MERKEAVMELKGGKHELWMLSIRGQNGSIIQANRL